jgi:hypothetical protein
VSAFDDKRQLSVYKILIPSNQNFLSENPTCFDQSCSKLRFEMLLKLLVTTLLIVQVSIFHNFNIFGGVQDINLGTFTMKTVSKTAMPVTVAVLALPTLSDVTDTKRTDPFHSALLEIAKARQPLSLSRTFLRMFS